MIAFFVGKGSFVCLVYFQNGQASACLAHAALSLLLYSMCLVYADGLTASFGCLFFIVWTVLCFIVESFFIVVVANVCADRFDGDIASAWL